MWPQIQRSISSAPLRALTHSPLAAAGISGIDPALARALLEAVSPVYQANWSFSAQMAGKPERSWSVPLPGASMGVLRRPLPTDAPQMASFLRSTPRGPLDLPSDVGGLTRAVLDLLWQAVSPGEDAFVLAKRDTVLGLAQIEREPEVCEAGPDAAWLAEQGYLPSEVCVGRMVLAQSLRGQGLGHLLKEAQLAAAGDAGYRAVVSAAGNDIGLAIARRAAGDRCRTSPAGWVLVPVPQPTTVAVKASGVPAAPGMARTPH